MKKRIIIFISVLILFSFSILVSARTVEVINPEYKDINIFRVVNGIIEPYKQVQLSSSIGGVVTEKKVKIGQSVNKGDELLLFEQDDFLINLQQAKAGLEIAEANLDKIKKGAEEEQIRIAEANVKQAKAALTIAKANYQLMEKGVREEDLKSLEATYQQALAAYEGAKESLALSERGFADRTMFKQQLINAEIQFISAEKQVASAKEGYEQAKNGQKQAENALQQAKNEYNRVKYLFQENVSTKNQLEMVEMQYKNAKTAFDNASSAVNSAQIAREQAKIAFQGAEDNYLLAKENFNNPLELEHQLVSARTQVEVSLANKRMAKANLEKADKGARTEELETAQANVKQAEAALEMVQAQLDQVLRGASNEDLRIAKANVKQAEVALQQVEKALADTIVKSPLNGIIAISNFEQGEIASPGHPLFVIVNFDKVYIKVDLTANLLRNISQGQQMRAAFLDYPGEYIEGKVDFISPIANPQTQAFTVKILAENPSELVRAGIFVDLYITTDSKENALVLPVDAVLDLNTNPYVYVVKENQVERVFIETGIENYKEVEVIAGVSKEDSVVIKGQRFLSNGDIVEVIN